MKRSSIIWNEEKWSKFMLAVDKSVLKTQGYEDTMSVEDYKDTIMLVIRKMERKISWVDINSNLINRYYSAIKQEAKIVDFNLELGITECFAGWWN
tara:strand:+ start:3499 stop:3786 length:288 start_codon:yes stop_codon:yes gene_type:complete